MNAKSHRESRGQLTLLGNGPAMFTRQPAFDSVSGAFDCVPTRVMHKTPSDPIVVTPGAMVVEPPAPRRDSVVSAKFFEEGERQELLGWKDSPLVDETVVVPAMQFSSFDRVPRRRTPLVLTMATAVGAAVIGFGALGMGAGVAHALLTTRTGKQATVAWQKAKTELSVKLHPRWYTAAERASARRPSPGDVAPPPVAEVAAPATSALVAVSAEVAASKQPDSAAPSDSAEPRAGEPAVAAAPAEIAVPTSPVKQPPHTSAVPHAQHRVVWSPTEQKVTVARPLSSWEQARQEMQAKQEMQAQQEMQVPAAADAPEAAPSAETGAHETD